MRTKREKWACYSFTSLFAFSNLTSVIFLDLKFDRISWTLVFILGSFVIPTGMIFLEISGHKKKLWKFWKSLPIDTHQIITIIFLIFTGYLAKIALPKIIKNGYEKN